MKKLLTLFALIPMLTAFNANGDVVYNNVKLSHRDELIIETADVEQFEVVYGNKVDNNVSFIDIDKDVTNNTITSPGAWDNNFVITDQFDTSATSYSFKTHVECERDRGDENYGGELGFIIYFNFEYYINFYLSYKGNYFYPEAERPVDFPPTVNGAVMYNTIANNKTGTYSYAKYPDSQFTQTSGAGYIDIWGDSYQWKMGDNYEDGKACNLLTSSTILGTNGYDLTLYVTKTTHLDRLVLVLQMQIDALGSDGLTPTTFFSPQYAVDGLTNPNGEGEILLSKLSPKIGFTNFNMGNVTYSNIEFKHNNFPIEDMRSSFTPKGETLPEVSLVDNDTGSVKFKNAENNKHDGFIIANDLVVNKNRTDFKATVTSTDSESDDKGIGFTVYYDDDNYALVYLKWNNTLTTIDSVNFVFNVDGNKTNSSLGGRIPWESGSGLKESSNEEFVFYSDYGAFIDDNEYPCGWDVNFNNFRNNSNVLIKDGFDISLSVIRTNFLNQLVDVYQIAITGLDTNGNIKTWYTPSFASTAFTYPKGDQNASKHIENSPNLGFYAHNCNEITFSDLEYNSASVDAIDKSKIPFGTKEENGWFLTGSNNGDCWEIKNDRLSFSWFDLEKDAHYLEVTALKNNNLNDLYVGGEITLTSIVGEYGLVGLYPYYLDENNYVLISLILLDGVTYISLETKLNGKHMGISSLMIDEVLEHSLLDGIFIEAQISGNNINVYLNKDFEPTYSFNFVKENFAHRQLTNSKVGFVAYNADGYINNYGIGYERILPPIIDENDLPIIYENGKRTNTATNGEKIILPYYVAYDSFNQFIGVNVSVKSPSGKAIKISDNSFVANEIGTYEVNISAVDEWGREATSINYTINVTEYFDPLAPINKDISWQTILVLSIFGGILTLSIALGILLVFKNKKERLLAEQLNKKNKLKNEIDEEDDE